MVAVFLRGYDDSVASLVKELDKVIADNKDKKAASFVSFLGDNEEDLHEATKKFGEENSIENVELPLRQP